MSCQFKEFSSIEVMELDRFRRIKNSSKYYGKSAQLEEAIEVKQVFPKIREKFMKIINSKLNNK